jgi:N-acetylglutamate synthase-like GNAT family acetyltransferase
MGLRPFLPSDKYKLRQLRCATRHDPDYQRLIGRMLRNELVPALNDKTREVHAFVAADSNSNLLGVVALENHGTDWEVAVLGVSVEHRRSGLASALIKFGVASTQAMDAESVFFLVHDQNEPMQRLVQSFDPARRPHPGATDYHAYFAEPAVIVRDIDLVMAKAQRAMEVEREWDDDDDWRLGIGLRGPK